MSIELLPHPIFKVSKDKREVVCPPEQVFVNPEFSFRLTIGGHLVGSNDQYQKLMQLFNELGETEYYVLENIGATITGRHVPFQVTVPVESDFDYFEKVVGTFEWSVGFHINHFFIHGKKDSWGIYICECPTILIIGCKREIADKFSKIFDIKGNGFPELKNFIEQEFKVKPSLVNDLIRNYKLV